MTAVSSANKFNRSTSACPICGGWETQNRGKGTRCAGFLSGEYALCTRSELAGPIPVDERTSPATYRHRLIGTCNCGTAHGNGTMNLNGSARQALPKPLQTPQKARKGGWWRDGEVGPGSVVTARYEYRDTAGTVAYRKVRYALPGGKTFRFEHPAPGADMWLSGRGDSSPLPWRLPDLLAAAKRGSRIFDLEGEKDTETVIALGMEATTAGSADEWRSEFAEHYRDASSVLIVADHDADGKGRKAADQRAADIRQMVDDVRVIEFTDAKDITAWFETGHTVAEFEAVVESAPRVDPPKATEHVRELIGEKAEPSPRVPPPPNKLFMAPFAPLVAPLAPLVAPLVDSVVGTLLSEVEVEQVDWLWEGRIPRGAVTVLDGDPGLGKSLLTVDFAARVSTGRDWPDGSPCALGGVVMLTAEDALSFVVKPRLVAAEADCSRVLALPVVGEGDDARPPFLPDDLDTLRLAIERVSAVLVTVDPLMAFFPQTVNSHRDQDVRRVMRPLAALAESMGVAIVVVRHLTKTPGGPAIYRGGGSIGTVAAARVGLMVGKDPEDPEGPRRILAPTKTNLGPLPPALAYRVDPAGEDSGTARVCWQEGTARVTADQLAAAPPVAETGDEGQSAGKGDGARDWLRDFLWDGEKLASEVLASAESEGIKERTLKRVKARLGVVSQKSDYSGQWWWSLPKDANFLPKGAKGAIPTVLGKVGTLGGTLGNNHTDVVATSQRVSIDL